MTDCQCDCAPCASCENKGDAVSTTKPTIMSRGRWTTHESGAPAVKPDRITGVAIHYPGAAGTIGAESDRDTASRLDGYRRGHVNGNGWSDIAYNVAVDQRGQLWTLRGISRQSGANGTREANRTHGAILALVGNSETPTPAMIAGLQYAIRLYDVRFPGQVKHVRPHRYFVQTACPGAKLRALGNDGSTLYVSGARERWPHVK